MLNLSKYKPLKDLQLKEGFTVNLKKMETTKEDKMYYIARIKTNNQTNMKKFAKNKKIFFINFTKHFRVDAHMIMKQ